MVASQWFVFLLHAQAWSAQALHFHQNESTEVVTCSAARVFDVGLPRTGTESFCKYGGMLGYSVNHQEFSKHITPAALHLCVQDAAMCKNILPIEDPDKPDMFCDHPLPGIGCQLAHAYPEAKFVLTTRSFDQFYASARYWMCMWGRDTVCPGKNERDVSLSLAAHVEIYGEAYREFCDQTVDQTDFRTLCGLDHGDAEEHVWSDLGLADLVKKMWADHDVGVRKCIPPDRLLVLDLESSDKAEKIGRFLGCFGAMPEYPHKHWISGTATPNSKGWSSTS